MPFKVVPPLYCVWNSMRQRCRNPRSSNWDNYGGRGITICKRWESYQAFEADMSPRPPGTVIDRIDNDGPYSPRNCRWVTPAESMRNTRVVRRVMIEGKEYLAVDLAKVVGVKPDVIVARVRSGLPLALVMARFGGRDARHAARRAATHCKRGHEFTPENTGRQACGRYCRTCDNENAVALRRKKAAG